MSRFDPPSPPGTRLDPKDLELIVGAIQRLSDRLEDQDGLSPQRARDLVGSVLGQSAKIVREGLSPIVQQLGEASSRIGRETGRTVETLLREHRERAVELERLNRTNRTWLWAAPSLVLAALIVAGVVASLAVRTPTGCTILGGTFETGAPGYADVCFFAR